MERRKRNRRAADNTAEENDKAQDRMMEEWLVRKHNAVKDLHVCAWCHALKPRSEFKDGRDPVQCKGCAKERVKRNK